MKFKFKFKFKIISLVALLFLLWIFFIFKGFSAQPVIPLVQIPQGPISCAVVLTGATGRVREGFELLQAQKIKKLIVSGVYKDTTFEELFPYWPYYEKVNEKDVVLEKRSQTTYGNAHQSLAVAEALKCEEVYLLTSQLHMPRALQIFLDVYPASVRVIPLALANSKTEQTFWAHVAELGKTVFYSVLSLVRAFDLLS